MTAQLNFNEFGTFQHSINIPGVVLLLYLDFQLLLACLAEHLASEEDFYFTELVICGFVK